MFEIGAKAMFEDVPQRLRNGERVPRAEIIGFIGSADDVRVTLACEIMVMAGLMDKTYEDETVKYGLTAFGHEARTTFITYLEGDCPDCP
jgi:hypothetical protein